MLSKSPLKTAFANGRSTAARLPVKAGISPSDPERPAGRLKLRPVVMCRRNKQVTPHQRTRRER